MELMKQLWNNDEGQDVAEYALMLGVILVLVVTSVMIIGSQASTIFSKAASSLTKANN